MKPRFAELILTNGDFITMDLLRPRVSSLAIAQGVILGVGGQEELQPLCGPSTKVLNLRGKMVTPGFHESHGHLIGLGRISQQLSLFNLSSVDKVVQLLKERLRNTSENQWIFGRGWDQNLWENPSFPTHHPLSQVSPGHPVCFTRVDGHACWVNQKALDLAKITKNTPDPAGGKILRDSQGQPTGILIDLAMDLVTNILPAKSENEEMQALKYGIEECLKHGITCFHDACSANLSISLYKKLWQQEQLKIRTYVMIDGQQASLLDQTLHQGPEYCGDHQLTIGAIKLFADGALGSCGAALHEEYCGQPGNHGLILLPEEEITQLTCKALERNLQVCTHAIGDKANTMVLNAYEKALQMYPERQGARLRVEHAELLRPEDIPRFARHGIVASMQATHCTSDMPWIEERIGKDRAKGMASLWRGLLDSGAIIANGSDAPIESLNPLWGFYSSITRQNHEGEPPHGWNPEQRMTRWEALRSFTLHGAYAAFAEKSQGSLTPGKLADLTVFSQDLLSIPEKDILNTHVLMTMIGGKIHYQHSHFDPGQ